MINIESTPLGAFKSRAKTITWRCGAGAVALAVFGGIMLGNAQSAYSSFISSSTSPYSYSSSSSLSAYQSSSLIAEISLAAAVALGAVATIAALAWVGVNLIVAAKQTPLGAVLSASRDLELEDLEGSVYAPIGTSVRFKAVDDSLVAINSAGGIVGYLNAEFTKYVQQADAVENASAFIASYHGDHPVVRIISAQK